ncbi:uncharacterized protein LOC142624020 [Castanea sativa]|uniref:uncharacterized protein LOC142624020 n=1 Tax=Castanea sativa TaxID=21020 RepID=UPI003F652A30
MFSSQIPLEFSQLSQMSSLDLSLNHLEIKKPSLGHLVENLTRLENLDLSWVSIISIVPNILGNLSSLTSLRLSDCQLNGEFPIGIFKLPNLRVLDVQFNEGLTGYLPDFQWSSPLEEIILANTNLSGKLPSSIGNLGSLTKIDMKSCNFSGFIPSSLGNLTNLNFLDLSFNTFKGHIPSSFGNLIQLSFLSLMDNELTSPIPFEFANLTQLTYLFLYNNFISGQIPSGLMNLTKLSILELAVNDLTGQIPSSIFNLENLELLDLSMNNFTAKLICNMSSLQVLDLSINNLSGSLPQCLHNFAWTSGSKLMMINFSQNKFQGLLPRSLAQCIMLKALDFSNNQFNDTFPTWLGNLPNLKLLILRSNEFYGPIWTHKAKYKFPSLQIFDLSYNSFTGSLPLKFFQYSRSSRLESANKLTYIQVTSSIDVQNSVINFSWKFQYNYAMIMINKGVVTDYKKVQELFTALDFSSNRFTGAIPEFIGNLNLKGLRLLNLSNNILTGQIPQGLKNLVNLESLDLSQNKLFGEIPQQLTQLTFLASFNVSNNHLVGPIPQGKQFNTFPSNSFEGNPGLCGISLTKKCKNSEVSLPSPSTPEESQDLGSPFQFGWKIVLIGYGFGLVVGVTIGQVMIARNQDLFMKTFGMRKLLRGLI